MPLLSIALHRARARRFGQVWRQLWHLVERHRSRRALARLDDRLLRDIGLTREEAQAELHSRLWDVPPHWRG